MNSRSTGYPVASLAHTRRDHSLEEVWDAFQAATKPRLSDGSTATPVQTLDYYPYGGTRVSSGSQLEARQYIGQFSDNSGLNYLNARYYDGNRGQFTSEDPVFWEIGLTQDGKNALANPQALNSFGYGNSNPIVNKDPLGRYIELSASLIAPGRAWSAGIRFDTNGVDYFLSGGTGYGLEAGFEAMWAPGVALTHTNQGSVSINGTVADGVGGRFSANVVTYDAKTKKTIPNDPPLLGLVIGAGGGASVQFDASAPIPFLQWNKLSPSSAPDTSARYQTASYSRPANSYVGTSPAPTRYIVQNNSTYIRGSSGGLTSTSLPATVSQGGTTYYRNSSGLLSSRPGL